MGTPRLVVRSSPIHGRGVYANRALAAGERLIEYRGQRIASARAARGDAARTRSGHTCTFALNDEWLIDGSVGGNSSRWINHSCDPNCEADEEGGRVFIKALRNIRAGEELNYDYGLIIDEPYTPKLKAEYPCWCNAKDCRGTLLAPKRKRSRK